MIHLLHPGKKINVYTLHCNVTEIIKQLPPRCLNKNICPYSKHYA